ncbi:MAG: hypothetical protein B0D92_00520 [Spirochaeta sp. LUC14_002_19_P3]|nr:MAG: hypothetical protein B0D92_00520 [Spirochaeta sp. LUC14_002_19_P3]
MPTYDYECRACGHSFEAFQSISEDALTDCPECRESQLRRLISGGTGIIFKGSGFYVNDTRKSGSDSKPKDTPAPVAASGTDSGSDSSAAKKSGKKVSA